MVIDHITRHALLSYAFRPMFLGLGVFAVTTMAIWIANLSGAVPAAGALGPSWHSHEMIFGFALAAVAGFLLTAVATWTGRRPLQRLPLLVLVAAWLLGRVAMVFGAAPSFWIAGLAMVFPVLLTVFVAREIFLGGSQRNFQIVAIVALLALLDGVYHLGTLGMLPGNGRAAPVTALYVMVVLISVVAGRIIPSFTGNWLRARGLAKQPVNNPWVERLVVLATALTGILVLARPDHPATGVAAMVTGALHALRLVRWRGLSTVNEPLLFILHIAYGMDSRGVCVGIRHDIHWHSPGFRGSARVRCGCDRYDDSRRDHARRPRAHGSPVARVFDDRGCLCGDRCCRGGQGCCARSRQLLLAGFGDGGGGMDVGLVNVCVDLFPRARFPQVDSGT